MSCDGIDAPLVQGGSLHLELTPLGSLCPRGAELTSGSAYGCLVHDAVEVEFLLSPQVGRLGEEG